VGLHRRAARFQTLKGPRKILQRIAENPIFEGLVRPHTNNTDPVLPGSAAIDRGKCQCRKSFPASRFLRRGALDGLRPRTLGAVGDLELDAITLAQHVDALAIDGALVKEVFLPRLTLDEPKAFVHSQRPNCSRHLSISDLWFLTIVVEITSTNA